MASSLIIVESPTKAKTISKFIGPDYAVRSSFGHIRDLPKRDLGVDVEHDFEPTYVIPPKSRKAVSELRKMASKAERVILATDEDREGEAIAWHLKTALKLPDNKIERIVFHEITKKAIEKALASPRKIDGKLVDAQQARRVLDRLVGYRLSPFLWKKVTKGLSAGRVQSVAVRLIVEREREIEAFKPDEYWTLEADFSKDSDTFHAKLHAKDGKSLDKLAIGNEKTATNILDELRDAAYSVASVEKKDKKRRALPPFRTSTLQQEANKKLGFSSKQTMRLAQQLYEGIELGSEGSIGLITYMRTDSLNLSGEFRSAAKKHITSEFGSEYYPDKPNFYTAKAKGAQEAHEAIRPTDAMRTPESVKPHLDARQYKLYDLIWRRAVASQMKPAITDATTVDIQAGDTPYTFRATGTIMKFDGFLRVYPDKIHENRLPDLAEKDTLDPEKLEPEQHFTQAPARYTEAALVKTLEEHGIGRPSTYAPTISTIIDRGYVDKEEKKLRPTEIATLVNDVLVEHFPRIVDYEFTAKMEKDLDEIAEGDEQWVPVIKGFYDPFEKNLEKKYEEVDKKKLTEQETDETCEKCSKPMVIKMGRYGKFLACTGFPDCHHTKPLENGDHESGPSKADEELAKQAEGQACEKCGKPMALKHGRFGPFLGCTGYPDCKGIKGIKKGTDVTCPECNKGEITEKRSRAGKVFYSCERYPDCKYALWSKPTGEKCPECSSLLVYGAKNTLRCSSKECTFKKPGEEQESEE